MQNKISGHIPQSLAASADTLRMLFLGANALTGPIPSSLGDLGLLTTLSLFDNLLTGTIPTSLGDLTQLRQLYLGGNKLVGTVPSQLCNIPELSVLSFSNNNNLTCYAACLNQVPVRDYGSVPVCGAPKWKWTISD